MRLLIAGGGTGGHIFPGIAIANEFMKLAESPRVLFVGTNYGLESTLVPAQGFSLHLIPGSGFKGKSFFKKLLALVKLPLGFIGAFRIVASFAPDLVLGVGGYAALTVCLSAKLFSIPVAIEEQNAIPGITNRLLGKFANLVAITFASAKNHFPAHKTVLTGLPIRAEILAVPPLTEIPTDQVLRILVVGGSQGAHSINQALIQALPQLTAAYARLSFTHQTGKADFEAVREAYKKAGVSAEVHRFIDDMAGAYRNSHLVIARAGASIMEIAACGRPMILVPYPHAADDHQRANAAAFQENGAAWVVDNDDFNGERCAQLINNLNGDRSLLLKMASQALQLAPRQATTEIVQACIRLGAKQEVTQHA